jgi:hypothetical protein
LKKDLWTIKAWETQWTLAVLTVTTMERAITYIARFDKSHLEREGLVKNLLMKGIHELDKIFCSFATAFECVNKQRIMNKSSDTVALKIRKTSN